MKKPLVSVIIPARFKSILEGCLLSDGNLRSEYNITSRYKHDSKFVEYLTWLKDVFEDVGIKTSKISKRIHKKINNAITYSFYTWSYKELKKFYDSWYQDKKKVIPEDFQLNKTSLIHWYLGDGSLVVGSGRNRKNKSIRLYTDAFIKSDVLRLMTQIKSLTQCNPTYQKSRNCIYIKDSEVDKFLNFLKGSPVKCFNYKFYYYEDAYR